MYVPKDSEGLGDYRMTHGEYEDGECFILWDYWRAAKKPDRLLTRVWRGRTTFVEKPKGIKEEDLPPVKGLGRGKVEDKTPGKINEREGDKSVKLVSGEDHACVSSSPPKAYGSLRPLESRRRSADTYYAPRDIEEEERPAAEGVPEEDDGLGHHGDPEARE